MNDTILLVDDDIRVVTALQRSLYRTYRIEIAASPEDALEAVRETNYAVVVSDLQMPGMNGVDLLIQVKKISPATVRVLLTGQADLDAAMAAVNEGNIFRFLSKPCPQSTLCRTLDAALQQYRLQSAEKEVLKETLTGTVAILVQILSAIQPLAFGRASRIRESVRLLRAELRLPDAWEFEAAAMLSQLGAISVDPRILQKYYAGEELSEEDRRHLLAHASIGKRLLQSVPRLDVVSQIIDRQYQDWKADSVDEPAARLIAAGSQMLSAALEFDRLVGSGRSAADALATMRQDENEFHPDVLSALDRIQADLEKHVPQPRLHEGGLDPEQLIFRPIAEEVLRALRTQSPEPRPYNGALERQV